MDFGWALLSTPRQLAAAALSGDDYQDDDAISVARHILALAEKAQECGTAVGWEGDYRNEPRMLVLPDAYSVRYAVVWKQDNNGDTYVVSEVPLDYLLSDFSPKAQIPWDPPE
jgi:hypothetical protein